MLALHLANRLLFNAPNAFARFVTWVSFVGLMLGVIVLTVVVSVMNGFDHELRTRLLTTIPHVTVGQDELDPAIRSEIPASATVSRYFQGVGAVNARGRVFPVTLYGIDPLADGASQSQMRGGLPAAALTNLKSDVHGILMGAPLARVLRADIGDRIRLMTVDVANDRVQPRILNFTLAGTFQFGAETDYSLAVTNLGRFSNREWRSMGDVGIQIQLSEPMRAREVAEAISRQDDSLIVASWETTFGELFQAVQLEKSMMFLLLLLVVAVAAFNIVAGQTMLVDDKKQNIAILRTMGARPALIRSIFFFQGAAVSVTGTLLGLLLGIGASLNINEILAWIEAVSGMHLLDGSYFVEVPVRIQVSDLLAISGLALAICLLAAHLPARRAAELDPVENLH